MTRVTLLIIIGAIVLIAGVIICLAWWKLADRWFPDAARKTGQEIRLKRGRRVQPDAAATVIKDIPRQTTEPEHLEHDPEPEHPDLADPDHPHDTFPERHQ